MSAARRHLPVCRSAALLGLLVGLGPGTALASASGSSTYAEANRAYHAGDHAEAIASYEALITAGVVHEHLFYNLGNAYVHAGELGRAVYSYERALRLHPGFADARENLRIARASAAARAGDALDPPRVSLWQRLIAFTPTAVLAWSFLLANALLCGMLIAHRLRGAPRSRRLSALAALPGVAAALCAIMLLFHISYLEDDHAGIVLPDTIELRETSDESSTVRARVHAGLRVHVIDSEAGWLKVRLGSGSEGWVPSVAIGRL